MSATTPTLTDRIKPNLQDYWQYWNLGQLEYFQQNLTMGHARFTPWNHTEKMAERDELLMLVNPEAADRMVPAGHYARLEIFQMSHKHEKEMWETVMSDTPDEMNDHEDVLVNATGRVLIHGLGLGCVLHCLLHKPDVIHIDVVELRLDVIELVRPFYDQFDNVTIHHDSCVNKEWPTGTRWNYVWHDIWSTISPSNLRQELEGYDTPEHGISYELLHRKFANRCNRQASWGFREARWMRRVDEFEEEYAIEFEVVWNLSDPQDRMNLLLDVVTPAHITKERWIDFLKWKGNEPGNNMYQQYLKACQGEITADEAKHILGDKLKRYARSKVKL